MITDGEEAGLRGCKQCAKDHKKECDEIETAVLCVDTLTDLEYLNVYSKDMTGTVKNSKLFSQLVMDSAIEAGHKDLKFASVFFGSSDAAALSQAGIHATCLAAMDRHRPTITIIAGIRRSAWCRRPLRPVTR